MKNRLKKAVEFSYSSGYARLAKHNYEEAIKKIEGSEEAVKIAALVDLLWCTLGVLNERIDILQKKIKELE